jgi:mannose-6-phosphate isomerase-like protein (cupin superfamily)
LPLGSSEVDIREQVANVRSAVQITGSPGPDAPVGSDSGEDSPVQLGAAARRDIYLISAEPGTPRRSDPHMPGVIEHVVLCAGRALVGVTEDPVELHPGDYITYPGDVAHVFEALDPGTVAVMVSEHG